jgi:hypothetical protein
MRPFRFLCGLATAACLAFGSGLANGQCPGGFCPQQSYGGYQPQYASPFGSAGCYGGGYSGQYGGQAYYPREASRFRFEADFDAAYPAYYPQPQAPYYPQPQAGVSVYITPSGF